MKSVLEKLSLFEVSWSLAGEGEIGEQQDLEADPGRS